MQHTSNQVSFHAGPAYAKEIMIENASQDPIGSAFSDGGGGGGGELSFFPPFN